MIKYFKQKNERMDILLRKSNSIENDIEDIKTMFASIHKSLDKIEEKLQINTTKKEKILWMSNYTIK